MAKRLLTALEYPQPDNVNVADEMQFRKLIAWVEENVIKLAPNYILTELKKFQSPNWLNHYNKYKDNLGCPTLTKPAEELYWILGYAVEIKTSQNPEVYLKHAVDNIQITSTPNVVTENPLDRLNFRSDEFKEGINKVAKLLEITPHPDPLVTLTAVRKVIVAKLNPQAVENPQEHILTGTPFPFEEADLGFDLHDPVLNKAAKVLRMLYIHDLRNLQTKANELIVAVQNVTANPKTDTKLGRVGR